LLEIESMIKSMTGFGKTYAEIQRRKFTIETRSLNSKQFDFSLKFPGIFRDREIEARNLLSQRLERGKIDLYISIESTANVLNYSINKQAAKKYQEELKELQAELNEEEMMGLLPLILKLPDVIQSGREEVTEEEWTILREGIEKSVALLDEFRLHEGTVLDRDIRSRIDLILGFLGTIEPFEVKRTVFLREKLRREFKNMMEGDRSTDIIDENRFEQELIFYLERLDITEEKVRLKKHCDYFLDTMDEQASQGKKLGFITQEIGREINTIGSKANDADIQKIVVQMKDELEKIKEQLLNIL
jgi:uncharacterized protein (TIGR00255 family)